MEKYIPEIYKKNIFSINYDNLISRGIKFLIFDIDNTIAFITDKEPNEDVIRLFKKLKKKEFKIMLASNSLKSRVHRFARILDVDYIDNCRKQKSDKLDNYVKHSKYKLSEIALIGDSMTDDIVCANRIGITGILVDQKGKKEFPLAVLRRNKERKIQKKLRDRNLFTKGRYYE